MHKQSIIQRYNAAAAKQNMDVVDIIKFVFIPISVIYSDHCQTNYLENINRLPYI